LGRRRKARRIGEPKKKSTRKKGPRKKTLGGREYNYTTQKKRVVVHAPNPASLTKIRTIVKRQAANPDFLQYWRVVRYWAYRKYDISYIELEIILHLYNIELFTKQQYRNFDGLFAWDKTRWGSLIDKGLIVKWREEKMGKYKQRTIYTLSIRAKRICSSVYKKLLKQEPIPENRQNNPIFAGNPNFTDKVYRKAIERMNMERKRQEREEKEKKAIENL